ncbi:MAG: hypothetical protein QXT86_12480 [Archaeoglobaceae archaeon]
MKVKVRRREFDGITLAYGVNIGHALEFEVPKDRAHMFKELGYEVVEESDDSVRVDTNTKERAKRHTANRVQ